ncbi:exonuclease domain-containing protein [Aeromonas rivuli]|uniref:exonuclease domain-containing protein n=1 Tax=Aeromonas rivuli TaxID=648794 RepID=UPI000A015697|nr:exonuclease domain-containing protein [Aeromonas rivuli]
MRRPAWLIRWQGIWAVRRTGQTLAESRCLAIDLELTGLNASRDHIVSMGWVPIVGREIKLAEARHFLIQTPVSVGQSAIYHGVHDRDLSGACSLATAFEALLEAAEGSLLVAHNSALERDFLQAACRQLSGRDLNLPFIDTMLIELARLHRTGSPVSDDSLTLARCLARHRLPALPRHHALEDAYGCALLLLAQTHARTRLVDLLLDSR